MCARIGLYDFAAFLWIKQHVLPILFVWQSWLILTWIKQLLLCVNAGITITWSFELKREDMVAMLKAAAINTRASHGSSINERDCKASQDRWGGGWVSNSDSPIQYQLTTTIPMCIHSLPFRSVLSIRLICMSLISPCNYTVDDACLSSPNSTRHSLSLSRQIIRIRRLKVPIPSDADRPQWQSVRTRKWAGDR